MVENHDEVAQATARKSDDTAEKVQPAGVARERGYDVEQVDAEIVADKTREKSLGLSFGSATPPSMKEASNDFGPAPYLERAN
jgi:hypothetical protein